ncbi:MAG TPA: hypothetical protein VF753_13645 [Terriglobales bacterium]
MTSTSDTLSSTRQLDSETAKPQFPQGLQTVLALLVLGAGVAEGWAFRNFVTLDGISYLDVADAYFSGNFKDAINGHWSPMYSWLLGGFLRVLHTTPRTEFLAIHLFNFVVFGVALVSFGHFLSSFLTYLHQNAEDSKTQSLSPSTLIVLSYIAFAWVGIALMGVRNTTPDLLVLTATLWATDLVVLIRLKGASWPRFTALGAVLAFGYLSKAIMFPLGFVFILASIFAARNFRQGVKLAMVAATVFVILSSPFILALSKKVGHLTFGESGRLNYGWYVNNMNPAFVHWHGQLPPEMGTPLHATRQVLPDIPVFEFATPIYGTYPVWYDPAYWYAGMRTHFSLREQLRAIVFNSRKLVDVLFDLDGVWIFSLTVLICTAGVINYLGEIWSNAFLLLPPGVALALYLDVLVVERYIAPFVLVILIVMLGCVRLPANGYLSKRIATAVLVATLFATAFFGVKFLFWSKGVLAENEAVPDEMWKVAAGASELGIRPGDKIAELMPAMGREDQLPAKTQNPVWARLLGVRITAELAAPHSNVFWSSDEMTRQRILQALASTGAKAVIDYDIPPAVHPEGWTRIDDTRFFFKRLNDE